MSLSVLTSIIVGLVALQHVGFLILEMFLWRKPVGLKVFKQTQAQANSSAVLAANQGLYNGFLAAGLIWSLLMTDPTLERATALFFLSCVAVAGTFGAATVNLRIFFVQALPALIGIATLFF